MTPDINILLAASRADHPHHQVAYSWLDRELDACATGGGLEILPMVAAGFLRMSTNARIFPLLMPTNDALDFLRATLETSGVSMPDLGREWPILESLCATHQLAANAIPDACSAAAVMVNGLQLATFDQDFLSLLPRTQIELLRP